MTTVRRAPTVNARLLADLARKRHLDGVRAPASVNRSAVTGLVTRPGVNGVPAIVVIEATLVRARRDDPRGVRRAHNRPPMSRQE